MKTALNDNEKILKQGAANIQRRFFKVGGMLFLTNERLIFEPHSLNATRQIENIYLEKIDQVVKVPTTLFGIPILSNSIKVQLKNGEDFSFVVWSGDWWISAIMEAKKEFDRPSRVNPQLSVADELRKLNDLLREGVISKSEFEKQKERLL